ncbi:MAG: D-alanine-D-alanine ligase-like ATP-grasp enzyme, partial [Pseudohongiellaceae bacterium]
MDTSADAPLRCCIVFGGSSGERDISAGSIKPWITSLAGRADVALTVVFLDREGRGVILPECYHYTNTCADFEIALQPSDRLSETAFDELLSGAELVVPVLHGRPGEDGAFAERLERLGVDYLFSRPQALAQSFDKATTYACLAREGLPVPAHLVISASDWRDDAG